MNVAATLDRQKLLREAREAKAVGKKHVYAAPSRVPWGTEEDVAVSEHSNPSNGGRAAPYRPEDVRPGVAGLPYGTDPDRSTRLADDFLAFNTPHPGRGLNAPPKTVEAPFGVEKDRLPPPSVRGAAAYISYARPAPFATEDTPMPVPNGAPVAPPPWMVSEAVKPTGKKQSVQLRHGADEDPQEAAAYGAYLQMQMRQKEMSAAMQKSAQREMERELLNTESVCAVTGAGLSSPPMDKRMKRRVVAPSRTSDLIGDQGTDYY